MNAWIDLGDYSTAQRAQIVENAMCRPGPELLKPEPLQERERREAEQKLKELAGQELPAASDALRAKIEAYQREMARANEERSTP